MITAATCQEEAQRYKALSDDVSLARASVLKNIARSFIGLSSQLDRLAALKRDEGRGR